MESAMSSEYSMIDVESLSNVPLYMLRRTQTKDLNTKRKIAAWIQVNFGIAERALNEDNHMTALTCALENLCLIEDYRTLTIQDTALLLGVLEKSISALCKDKRELISATLDQLDNIVGVKPSKAKSDIVRSLRTHYGIPAQPVTAISSAAKLSTKPH
jgi:hypothetical protein